MESEVSTLKAQLRERSVQIFKDFMRGITELEQLGAIGSQFLEGYQQALELIRRSPINVESGLVASIIKNNETERMKSYIVRGCIKDHDRLQNLDKLGTCAIGLRGHLSKAKSILNELHSLVDDLVCVVQTATSKCLLPLQIEDLCNQFDLQANVDQDETPSSDVEELKMTDYATPIAIIYKMVEQDYVMQEKIVTSLSFKTSFEELASYCMMWSLHPYIDNEFMHQAWSLIK